MLLERIEDILVEVKSEEYFGFWILDLGFWNC